MSRFSRLPLLYQILLSTTVAITLLFALTGQVVLNAIQRTVTEGLVEETRNSFQAYTSLLKARAELLASVSRILSTMNEVRLAFNTGDRATIQDTAKELWYKISDANAIFLVTDPGGNVLASLGGVTPLSQAKKLDVVLAAEERFPQQSSGFFLAESGLYHISVSPVYVDSTRGQGLLNVLVAGYQMDAVVAQDLKAATHSEFLFLTPGHIIASTLNERATGRVTEEITRSNGGEQVSDGVTQYALFRTPLRDLRGQEMGELCILRSFEAAQQRIATLKRNIILLWLGVMAAGLCLTYLLARRIVEPVKKLDLAAAEVTRRNYAIEVHVEREDEIGRLARTFNEMCASIRQAREDLIRQERISTIGRLSGSIVHDLRNPLAAIYGGAEMLVDTDLPPAHVKRLAGNIYRASRRIQELLQDLVNVSRGKSASPEMCRLREVAAAACESLASSAEAQKVALSNSIPPEIELPLERSRIERAFVNLIGNALEVMPDGGEVRISAAIENGAALVRVEDTGPGIAPEIRGKLFQPFVSAGKRNGLGLGLALSRQAVIEHGGDMWADAGPGRGARLMIRLPGAHVAQVQSVHA
jgi:signal transduction histidine kinase